MIIIDHWIGPFPIEKTITLWSQAASQHLQWETEHLQKNLTQIQVPLTIMQHKLTCHQVEKLFQNVISKNKLCKNKQVYIVKKNLNKNMG